MLFHIFVVIFLSLFLPFCCIFHSFPSDFSFSMILLYRSLWFSFPSLPISLFSIALFARLMMDWTCCGIVVAAL